MKAKLYATQTIAKWLLVMVLCMITFLFSRNVTAQSLVTEDFNYTVGTALSANGWTAFSGAGTNTLTVTSPGLTYTGFIQSGIGNATSLTTSGEDASLGFTTQNASAGGTSVYAGFMLNISAAQTTGDYFFAFYNGASSVYSGGRLYAKSSGTGYVLGLSKDGTTITYSTTVLNYNQTYFIVVRHTTFTATTTDDVSRLYINPTLGSTEPAAEVTSTAGTDPGSGTLNRIALRQGTAANAPTLRVDGFRVGTTWAYATASTSAVAPTVTTTSPFSVNGTTASVGGNVTADGGASVTRRGIVYSTGAITDTTNTTGGGKVIDASTGTGSYTANLTGLSTSTTYNVKAFAINSAGITYGANQTFTTLANDIAAPPTTQPTALSITALTCNGMNVSWTAASSGADGYIVLQTTGSTAPNTNPVGGTGYSQGSTLGNATVAYVGSGTSFSLSSLPDSTQFNFTIYSYNGSGSGSNYLTPSPLTGTTKTLAPAALTANSATNVYSNSLTANWTGSLPTCANSLSLTLNGVENFENSLSLFTASGTGGLFVSGTNSTGSPSTATFASSGTYGYAVSNGTGVLTSIPLNTSSFTSPTLSFKVSAMSYLATGNGIDASDSLKVEISPDNGNTWYYTAAVNGSVSNAFWAFGSATVGSTAYDGDNTPVVFSGNGTSTGVGTVLITGLPTTNSLRVRITMKNNAAAEAWVIDEFRLSTTIPNVSGNTYTFNNINAGIPYTYTINSVGTNSVKSSNAVNITTLVAAAPSLGASSVANITSSSANLTAIVTSIGSTATMSSRGIALKTSAGVTLSDNPQADASATTGSFTQTRTLNPETRYYFRGYATNAEGTGYSAENNFFTLSNPPTAQASSLTATPFSSEQLDLGWTGASFPATGATAKRYMLLMATAPNTPSVTAVNGSAWVLGANTVMINASISSDASGASATGLTAGTEYNFLLIPYTWNGVDTATISYLTAGAATTSGTTTTVAPPVLTTTTVNTITNTSAILGATITSDGGDAIADRGTVYNTSSPVTIFNNLLSEGGTSTGSFSHLRTDLLPQTRYYFAGYALNSGAIGLSPEANFITLSNPPTAQASSLSATAVSGTQINLSWTAAAFPSSGASVTGYVLLRAVYPNVPSLTNSNGQAPIADANTTIVSSTLSGFASSANSTGLAGTTRYNYVLVPFTWDGVNAATYNYLTTGAPSADATTLATAPTAQPTGLTHTNVTCNGMSVTYRQASPAPAGYIVLQSAGATAPNTDPVSGVVYTAGSSIGNATVAYVGTDTTFAISSLTDNTNYNFKIYSYNGSGTGNISYLTTAPLAGSRTTVITASPLATAGTETTLTSFKANWDAATCANSYKLDVSSYPNFYNPSSTTSTIAAESFENALSLFSSTGTGSFYLSGSSSTGSRPATSPFATDGTYGLGVANGRTVLTSNNINTLSYEAASASIRLAAFSYNSTAQGLDASDTVNVEVSPDGGISWYNTLLVRGLSPAIWEFAGTGLASAVYDGDNVATGYQAPSTTTGVTIPNGFGTLRITNLPKSANLKFRITLKNDNTAELWVVDDFKVIGYNSSLISPYDDYTVAGTSQTVSGLTYNTNYYYRVRAVGTNSTSLNSNTINVATEAGFATLGNMTVSSITQNSAVLGATVLTPGSGGVIFDRGTVYNNTSSVTATTNALSEGGTTIDAFSHSRTGLNPETKYWFAGYASNSYGTGLSSLATFYTLSNPPSSAVSNLTATAFSGDQINLSWSGASFPSTGATTRGYVIVRANHPNIPTLSNGNGQAPVAGANSTIVMTVNGTTSTAAAMSLAALTQYNFTVIPFTWNGVNDSTRNYYSTGAPSASATTFVQVIASAPTGFNVSNLTCNGMTVNWTPGANADGSLVVMTTGATAPNTSPSFGVEYSAGNTIGNATVVYAGTGNSISLSSLLDNTNHQFKIYSYNGSGSSIGYLTSSPLTGAQVTSLSGTPVANAATGITSNSFGASWSAASCANNYQLTVYTNNANNPIAGWTFPVSGATTTADTATVNTNASNIGKTITLSSGTIGSVTGVTTQAASASAWSTIGKNWQIIVNTVGYTNITVSSAQYSSASGPRDFKIQYKVGAGGTWTDVAGGAITVATNFTTGVVSNLALPAECAGVTDLYIRWATTSTTAVNLSTIGGTNTGGTNRIDNIFVRGNLLQVVPGYNGSTVNGTSVSVSGLLPLTTYYYQVKSVGPSGSTSAASNVISLTTNADQSVADFRTKASGNMSDANIWEYLVDGVNFAQATQAPGANNNTLIRSTDSVYLDLDQNIGSGKTMTINGVMNANTKLLFGNGSVVVAPASTFYTAHPNALASTGSISTTARTLSDSANYAYTGTVAQTTGSLPSPLKGNVIIYNNNSLNVSTSRVITAPGSFIVKSGAVVTFGSGISTNSYSLTGTGNFVAETGSTLILTSSNGISVPTLIDTLGNIRLTGTRSFASGINYNFTKNDGTSTSRFGTSFGSEITGINNLTINNPVGALLNASNVTVNGTLNLVAGKLTTGAYKVSLASGASVTKTDTSWVIGNMEKTIATGATSVAYEVGADASNYTPVNIAFGNVTTAGNLTVNAVNASHPNVATSALSSTKRLSFYASMVNNGVVFNNYSATLNYNPAYVVGGANAVSFIAGNHNSGWTYPSVSGTSSSITANGMTSIGDIAIGEVNCTIAASAGSNSPLCYLNTINLTSGATGAHGAVTYSWSGPMAFTSSEQNPSINFATGGLAGTYTVTITDALGCTSTASTNVVVNINSSSEVNATVCSANLPYVWNGNSYSEAGDYVWHGTNANGCDSAVTLHLSVTTSTSNTTSATACDSYTWSVNGQTYTSSGSYTSVSGCVSSILNLTITASTTNTTTESACGTYTWTVNGQTYTASGSYTSVSGCATSILNLTILNCSITMNVKAFLQGSYTGNGSMAATLFDLGESTDATATDTVEVNLWSAATTATATAPAYSAKVILHTNGMASVTFPGTALGGSYYVAIRHRNSLETWSASPITTSSTNSVDFSASLSAAYGDGVNAPMANMGSGVYALYSGDVNQDGSIDLLDLFATETDASGFAFGYNASDCNGDGGTDLLDLNVIENNASLFLFYARPY